MVTIEDIYDLLMDECGIKREKLNPEINIHDDCGVTGDDFHELMERYAKEFQVNMESYLWYFHTAEEVQSMFGLLFPPPDQQVTTIVVSPNLLVNIANSRKWNIQYPEHVLTKNRWDIVLSQLSWILIPLVVTVLYFLRK